VPSNETDPELLCSTRLSVDQQTEAKAEPDAPVEIVSGHEQKKEHFGKFVLALLIVLHNGFYAFAFEVNVVTTCEPTLYAMLHSAFEHDSTNTFFTAAGILISFKPVDVWTSMYIVHLLVCLISEDSQYNQKAHLRRTTKQNEMMRLMSFSVLVLIMAARYALVLGLQREFFSLEPSWSIWLGLSFNPAVFPGMTFSKYFAFDFAIILMNFFYLRQIVSSSMFACVKSHDPRDARHVLLVEYLVFATKMLRGLETADVDKSRFSFFEIYRQIGLNFDRISAFVGLVVLVFSNFRGFPSLPNLVITFLITIILTQFEPIANNNEFKRKSARVCAPFHNSLSIT
jgi:hypothetical protein